MGPQQTPRIVSKSRYLGYLGKKATLGGSGVLMLILGILGDIVCAALIAVICAKWGTVGYTNPGIQFVYIAGCLFAAGVFGWMAWSGNRQVDKSLQLEPVVPLTRQTAEQLPAEQSLVRAASAPSEMQQAILLRAAGSDTQTPPEELLRASTPE